MEELGAIKRRDQEEQGKDGEAWKMEIRWVGSQVVPGNACRIVFSGPIGYSEAVLNPVISIG